MSTFAIHCWYCNQVRRQLNAEGWQSIHTLRLIKLKALIEMSYLSMAHGIISLRDFSPLLLPDWVSNQVSIAVGCCDKTRNANVVLIHCRHPAWTSQYLTTTNLTTLLLYYQHLSRWSIIIVTTVSKPNMSFTTSYLHSICPLHPLNMT